MKIWTSDDDEKPLLVVVWTEFSPNHLDADGTQNAQLSRYNERLPYTRRTDKQDAAKKSLDYRKSYDIILNYISTF